jgi:phage gp16-like protein
VTVRINWTGPEGIKDQYADMTRTELDDEALAKKIVEILKGMAKGEPEADPSDDHALRG